MAAVTNELPKPRTKQSPKLKWSVPRWSNARDLKKLLPVVFGVGPIIRIVAVSVIVGAAICFGVKLAFPQIQLGFAWKALFGIPAMFAYLGFWFLIRLLIPGQVKITEKYILLSTGQSGWRAKLSDIESSQLVIYSPDHVRLIIRIDGKVRKFALPPSTDFDVLMSLLPSTVVLDKRGHFAAARRLVATARSSEIAGEPNGEPERLHFRRFYG